MKPERPVPHTETWKRAVKILDWIEDREFCVVLWRDLSAADYDAMLCEPWAVAAARVYLRGIDEPWASLLDAHIVNVVVQIALAAGGLKLKYGVRRGSSLPRPYERHVGEIIPPYVQNLDDVPEGATWQVLDLYDGTWHDVDANGECVATDDEALTAALDNAQIVLKPDTRPLRIGSRVALQLPLARHARPPRAVWSSLCAQYDLPADAVDRVVPGRVRYDGLPRVWYAELDGAALREKLREDARGPLARAVAEAALGVDDGGVDELWDFAAVLREDAAGDGIGVGVVDLTDRYGSARRHAVAELLGADPQKLDPTTILVVELGTGRRWHVATVH